MGRGYRASRTEPTTARFTLVRGAPRRHRRHGCSAKAALPDVRRVVSHRFDTVTCVFTYWQYRRMLTDAGRIEMREVYFDADGTVVTWTVEPADVWGETEAELADEIAAMTSALAMPLLVETELPGYGHAEDDPRT